MTIRFSANGRSGSANVHANGTLSRFGWLVGVLPLIPGWILAFALSDMGAPRMVAFGVVAIAGAAGLGLLLWRFALREFALADLALSRFVRLMLLAAIATAIWVWLQYALNPFRTRAVLDALLVSRATPWQAVAGLCLFASICVVAYVVRYVDAKPTIDERVESAAPRARLQHLSVRSGKRTELVDVDDIDRLQAWDDYVAIFVGGRRMLADHRLSELAIRLDPNQFLRVHRSHIVNLHRVRATERRDANRDTVVLSSGERIPASRTGSAALRRWLSTKTDMTV
jgi:DNA-binding LytR/AlgR family response regulator